MILSRIARALLRRPSGSATPAHGEADRLIDEGNRAEGDGDLARACECYRAASAAAPEYARAHLNLGIGLEASGDADAALASYERALACSPGDAYALYNLGKLLYARGAAERAAPLLVRALEAKPGFPEASIVLAHVRESQGDAAAAAALLERAVRERPDDAGAVYSHALVLQKLDRAADAESALRRVLELEPGNTDAALRLGNLLASRHALQEAAAAYEKALASKPDFADALCNLGNVLHLLGRIAEAQACYERAIALDPAISEAHYNLANLLKDQGRREDASRGYRAALALDSEYAEPRWALAMAQIPTIYADAADVPRSREAFVRELGELERWFSGERSARGHAAVGAQQPFYLAYQEESNAAILDRYGRLCARLMQQWLEREGLAPARPRRREGPMRIGIASHHFYDHSVWNAIVKGWAQRLDPDRFDVHAFYLGSHEDAETAFARSHIGRFERGPRPLRRWVDAILGADLDVLIYPEIGMDTTAVRLASLRLAPVQAATWGHPETSGLPTIDYFISAAAFEPPGAEVNYTERLVSLPGVGCYYEPAGVVPAAPDLAALGIADDAPVLVCAGSPFKYAPAHDAVLIEIARRLGRCRFLFFTHRIPGLTSKLQQRLSAAFSRAGLSLDRFALFVPWQSAAGFQGLLHRAHVYLDTIGFSGFNTAMQALECGLPVVALQGRFMRGRLASGTLRHVGLDDLVADSTEAYVALAVRLCRDADYRESVRSRIVERRARAWRDESTVRALEGCLETLAREARSLSS